MTFSIPALPPGQSSRRHALLVLLSTWAGLSLAGCSSSSSNTPPPLDAAKARETLQAALESWKKGEAPDALLKLSPPIYAQDADWVTGRKLTNYSIVSDGEPTAGNLAIPVTITLTGPKGATAEKQVIFLVTTAPHLTVTRDFLQ